MFLVVKIITHHPLHPVVGGPDVLQQGLLVILPLLGQARQVQHTLVREGKVSKINDFIGRVASTGVD